MRLAILIVLGLAALLQGCASAPERPATVRQALLGLGESAAEQVATALPRPATDQVLLLDNPDIDPSLGVTEKRLLESLTRALLGLDDPPQVLDWHPGGSQYGPDNQWQLRSRLTASGPRLSLSDRELLPYRLTLTLTRPGNDQALWQAHIDGALDATAL